MAIKYEAYTWQGEKVEGVLDTDSEQIAYERLQQDQLIPYRLRIQRRRRSLVQLFPNLFRPAAQDVIDFTRQMASLLKAGVSLRRGLAVQRDSTRNLGFKYALGQVIEEVEAGGRLSDACARHKGVFPELFVRIVRVGEATGGMGPSFRQLTETMTKRKAIRDKVQSALTYPAISIGVAIIAGVVLTTYSLPSLTGLLEEFGGTLPFATRVLISIAGFLESYGLIMIASMFAVGLVVAAFFRTRTGARILSRMLLNLPVVGKVLMNSSMFFLTTNLKTLLEAGLSPIEGMKMAGEGMTNVTLRERLEEVTRVASEGTKLGEAFSQQSIFPLILSQSMVSGETSGGLADTLSGLSDYYELETEKSVTWATDLIQPVVIVSLAALIGFVAIAIVAGIYSTIGAIK